MVQSGSFLYLYDKLVLPCGRGRLLQRRGSVFAVRSNSHIENLVFAPCDMTLMEKNQVSPVVLNIETSSLVDYWLI